MIEAVGFVSAALLAGCGIPQAYKSWKTKKSSDISAAFMLTWLAGEVLLLVYAAGNVLWPMMLNASVNIFVIGVILKYYRADKK